AEYYQKRPGANAALMTDIACVAWNASVRRHGAQREGGENVMAKFRFRGVECELVEDYGHIWGRDYEHEENRILARFETLLDELAAAGGNGRLRLALDHLAARYRTSLMWMVFMQACAKHPATLVRELEPSLSESLCFTHADYNY